MASNDVLARLLDAGMSFTQMTQARAEAIVKDLTKTGDIRKKEAQRVTQQLVDMIVAQRNFQANAQMISTQDQITQTIINLR